MTRDDVLNALLDWKSGEEKIAKLQEKLEGKGYKITPTLSLSGGLGGGGFQSKVEDYCLSKLGAEASLNRLEEQRKALLDAINLAGLTELELGVIQCVMQGGSLAGHARNKGIYVSRVYKLRDRAATKILKKIPKTITRFEW